MKKLLNISVIAALAVLPFAANAAVGDIVSVTGPATAASASQVANDVTATNDPKYALATVGDNDGNVATAGYVKGAYNAAIKAINKVSETASNALTANGTATLTNKSIDANGTGNNITNIETDNFNADAIVTSTEAIKLDGTGSDTALTTEKAVAGAITTATNGMVTETGTQTLTNKEISGGTVSGATITGGTIDASSTNISNLDTGDFASDVVRDSGDGIRAVATAEDDKLVTEKAVASALANATTGQVTETGTQSLTNKTIDADSNTITNIEVADMKGSAVVNSSEGIQATASASDDALVTEKAVAATLDNYAKKTGVTQTITNSTIAGTVPTVTVWGVETPGTAQITASITGATYAEQPASGGGD